MKKLKLKPLLAAMTLCLAGNAAQAVVPTNFQNDVTKSIDDGLAYLDSIGAFNNPSNAWDAVGLTTLALLEKRAVGDPNGDPQGYAGATPDDQARLRRSVRHMLDQINAQGAGNFYAYRDGGYMMALSLYMRTGGPDQDDGPTTELDGAPLKLIDAYNMVVDRTLANQRKGAVVDRALPRPEDNGYWCYNDGSCRDSSTTQLVVAGLAAARTLYSDPAFADPARLAAINSATALARTAYQRNGTPGDAASFWGPNYGCGNLPNEKGHAYNIDYSDLGWGVSYENSLQQTASGTWIQLVGGANLNDPDVQLYLRWIQHRYGYSGFSPVLDQWPSDWYYMWSFSKAMEFLITSGVTPSAGNIGPENIGTLPAADAPACTAREIHRNPVNDLRVARFGAGGAGYYGDETPRVYYDFAYNILSWQCPNGNYACNGQPTSWNDFSRNAYALLVLQRSVGGGEIDTDQDGIADPQDNCPAISNPNQEDGDGDGVGNVCDNCPTTSNPDQADTDRDGTGDACEIRDCDVDGDGDIDKADISLINKSLYKAASGPTDPRDPDHNGIINTKDAKICVGRIGQ